MLSSAKNRTTTRRLPTLESDRKKLHRMGPNADPPASSADPPCEQPTPLRAALHQSGPRLAADANRGGMIHLLLPVDRQTSRLRSRPAWRAERSKPPASAFDITAPRTHTIASRHLDRARSGRRDPVRSRDASHLDWLCVGGAPVLHAHSAAPQSATCASHAPTSIEHLSGLRTLLLVDHPEASLDRQSGGSGLRVALIGAFAGISPVLSSRFRFGLRIVLGPESVIGAGQPPLVR